MNHSILTLLVTLFVAFQSGCVSSRPLPTGDVRLLTEQDDAIVAEFNNLYQQDDVYFAGYVTEAGLREMSSRGVTKVVSLKTPEQVAKARDIDEQAIADGLGLELTWLPISPDSFSQDDVDRFASWYENSSGPVLIHCGSSNTVGGLWAEYLHRRHRVSVDDAIERGRAVGLRSDSMVEAVRRVADD